MDPRHEVSKVPAHVRLLVLEHAWFRADVARRTEVQLLLTVQTGPIRKRRAQLREWAAFWLGISSRIGGYGTGMVEDPLAERVRDAYFIGYRLANEFIRRYQ